MIEIKIQKCDTRAITPTYATLGSACFDLYACLTNGNRIKGMDSKNKQYHILVEDEEISIPPGIRVLVPTGVIFGIPEGYCLKIYNRSGIPYKNGVILGNAVGIVDDDYPEQTLVMLFNLSEEMMIVQHGNRIAQASIEKHEKVCFEEVFYNPANKTNRISGLGSTGK
jgi:dUTP pyrophosphatase